MGDSHDDRAVVDPLLKVKGVHNLRVADASIIPKIPNGNVHTTVVFVAMMCINLLLKSNKTLRLIVETQPIDNEGEHLREERR